MRERSLLYLFLGLNMALAGAFIAYLFISTSKQTNVVVVSSPLPPAPKANAAPAPSEPRSTSGASRAAPRLSMAVATNEAPPKSSPAPPRASLTPKKFGWQEVATPAYQSYVDSLRAVGCPDAKVSQIVLADIDEFIRRQRQKEAEAQDLQWWKLEPRTVFLGNTLQEKSRTLEEQRRKLVETLLGREMAESVQGEPLLWNVQLTGRVLGGLPSEKHNAVQEICRRSLERQQQYLWARFNENQAVNQVEQAKLREQTRSELRQLLSAEELEEFLLRYSQNAERLRAELGTMDPSPEEFRSIFRVVDPLEHQMQLEFGSVEAMSAKQRERYERQREEAIREVLGPQRHQVYLLGKDPLYQQAQMMALQYGAPKAVMPIYQMTKANETRKEQILRDAQLSPEKKSEALNRVLQEQQRSIQQIIIDTNGGSK